MSDVTDEIINNMINYDYDKYKKFLNNNNYLNNEIDIKNIFNIYNNIKDEKIKIYYYNIIINILHYNIEKDIENDKILIGIFEQEYKDKNLFINKFYGEKYNYGNFNNKMKSYNKNLLLNTSVLSNNIFIKNNNKYDYTNIYYLKYKNIFDIDNIYKLNSFSYNENLINYYNNENNVNITDLYIENNTKNNILDIHSKCFSKDIVYNNIFKYIYKDEQKKFYILTKYYSNNNINYDINYDNNLILYLLLGYKEKLITAENYNILEMNNTLENYYNNNLQKCNLNIDFFIHIKVKDLCLIHLFINKILHDNKDEIINNNIKAIEKYNTKNQNIYKIENNEIYINNIILPCICKYNYFIFLLHDYIFREKKEEYDKDNFLYYYYVYRKEFFEIIKKDMTNLTKKYFIIINIKIKNELCKFTTHFCIITIFNCMYYYTLNNTEIQKEINNNEIQNEINNTEINYDININNYYYKFNNNFINERIHKHQITYFINNKILSLNDFKEGINKSSDLFNKINEIIDKKNVDLILKNKEIINDMKNLKHNNDFYNNTINNFNNYQLNEKIKKINTYFIIYNDFNNIIFKNLINDNILINYKNNSQNNIKKNNFLINQNEIVNSYFYNNKSTLKFFINKFYNIFLYFYLLLNIINDYLKKINIEFNSIIFIIELNRDIDLLNNIIIINHIKNIDMYHNKINYIYNEFLTTISNQKNEEIAIINKDILKNTSGDLNGITFKLNEIFKNNDYHYLKDLNCTLNDYTKKYNLFHDTSIFNFELNNNYDGLLFIKFEFLYKMYDNTLKKFVNIDNDYNDKINVFNNNLNNLKEKLKLIIKDSNDDNKLISDMSEDILKSKKEANNIKIIYNKKYFYFKNLYKDNNLQRFYDYMYVINHKKFNFNFNNNKLKKKILNYNETQTDVNENNKYIELNNEFFKNYFNNLKKDLLYDNNITKIDFEQFFSNINKIEDTMINANILLNKMFIIK